MNKKYMLDQVFKQLAIDYNCEPDDFMKNGLIFTKAKKLEGRRPYPFMTPRLEMISFGNSVVINASSDITPAVCKQLDGKSRDEVFSMPFVYGINQYFLPDIEKMPKLDIPNDFEYEFIEKENVHKLYELDGFDYVLQYDINSPFTEMLVVLAKDKGKVVAMAGANIDSKNMRGINVDVLPSYRGKGLASALVNRLTAEVLNHGYIPYYFTSSSNVLSARVAVRAGFSPAWVHCYRTRLELL